MPFIPMKDGPKKWVSALSAGTGITANDQEPFEKDSQGFLQVDTGKSYKGTMCYNSHPPLPIGGAVIYGGSCLNPVVPDADVYVGFASGMKHTERAYPWTPGAEFDFPIPDGGTPAVEPLRQLVAYLAEQLAAGKKVHIGCIGGHGRTGLVLAVLVNHVLGEVDAIGYVRTHYCVKAVESTAQVDFLEKHFGVKRRGSSRSNVTGSGKAVQEGLSLAPAGVPKHAIGQPTGFCATVRPMRNSASIWGDSVV